MANSTRVEKRLLAIVGKWPFPIGQDCRKRIVGLVHETSLNCPELAANPIKMAKAETKSREETVG